MNDRHRQVTSQQRELALHVFFRVNGVNDESKVVQPLPPRFFKDARRAAFSLIGWGEASGTCERISRSVLDWDDTTDDAEEHPSIHGDRSAHRTHSW